MEGKRDRFIFAPKLCLKTIPSERLHRTCKLAAEPAPLCSCKKMMDLFVIVILLYVIYLILIGVKVVKEDERIALLRFGKLDKLIGPGLSLITLNQAKKIEKIYLGQEGEYLGKGIARFCKAAMPVVGEYLDSGSTVRIISFDDNKIHIQKSANKEVICPHCGEKIYV